MNLSAQHSLVAGESLCDRMVVVGTHLFHRSIVSNIDNDAATRFA
jgi:hypothetical protein